MFLLRDLVSPRTWLAMIHHLAGLFIGLAAVVVFIVGLSVGFGLLVVARAGYRWGVVPRWRMLAERATWGDIGYALLRLPVSTIAATLSLAAWAAGLVMLTLPLYNSSLPSGGAELGDVVLRGTPTMAASAAIGLLVLLAAPQLTRGLAVTDAAMSRRLLGPPSDLAARVTELETSRERVVDAAENERRRIERDLHDGAQQRLVALAMELGRAKARFADDPDAARVLV